MDSESSIWKIFEIAVGIFALVFGFLVKRVKTDFDRLRAKVDELESTMAAVATKEDISDLKELIDKTRTEMGKDALRQREFTSEAVSETQAKIDKLMEFTTSQLLKIARNGNHEDD